MGDVDRGPHGSSAPAWHLPQPPQSSQGWFVRHLFTETKLVILEFMVRYLCHE